MTFIQSIETCLGPKYATFKGRASRSEYGWFILFQLLAGLAFGLIVGSWFPDVYLEYEDMLTLAFFLCFLIPNLAAGSRRLHDLDRNGWLVLILFIPLIGVVVFGCLLIVRGTEGGNQYGPDPTAAKGPWNA